MRIIIYILCAFLALRILRYAVIKSKIYYLKRQIQKQPLIGIQDLDGTRLYKKNGYALRYSIKELSSGEKKIQWISSKLRLTGLELVAHKIRRLFQRLLIRSRLKPYLISSFSIIIFIIYLWVLIPEPKKIAFYKSALSRIVGVNPEEVEYKGGGWFEVYGKRIMPGHTEQLTFTVNPLRWLFFADLGSVTRWRGKDSGGYRTHELKADEQSREITRHKYIPVHGKKEGDKIEWDRPVGSGSTIQDIEIEKEGIRIIDR